MPPRLGQPSLFPTERPFVFTAADWDQQLVHLDRSFVREVAAERHDVADGALRFDHLRQPDVEAVQAWRESLGVLARARREGGTDSLVRHEAKRGTAAAFLRLVPPLTHLRQVRRWGFAHLGRFSAVCADRFGEYPRQTLRR